MELDLHLKDEGEVLEHVSKWVALSQNILKAGVEYNRERLKTGVDNIAAKCNDNWEVVNECGTVEFAADDLGIDLTAITDTVAVAFAGHTAVCVLAGMDGPFLTAQVMKDAIDTMADEIEGRPHA